jgi:hypothetical protein
VIVLRLLLRFILVPLGYLAATIAGAFIILFGSWKAGTLMLSDNPDAATAALFGSIVAGPILVVVLLGTMWLPASVGIIISEAFAIRSWIYHAANGGLAAWIGWSLMQDTQNDYRFLAEPRILVAAGLAGGLAYWVVAGSTAGFWKPVFRSEPRQA